MKEWKGHQILKKGTAELQKEKETASYPDQMYFWDIRDW